MPRIRDSNRLIYYPGFPYQTEAIGKLAYQGLMQDSGGILTPRWGGYIISGKNDKGLASAHYELRWEIPIDKINLKWKGGDM